MNNLFHVAFYLRSATGNLVDIRRQKRFLEKEFIRRGLDAAQCQIKTYIDYHQSGMSYGPELSQLIEQIHDGQIKVVMVSEFNRISRSLKGLMEFQNLIEKHKIRFISARENIDSIYRSEVCPQRVEVKLRVATYCRVGSLEQLAGSESRGEK